MKGLVIGFWIDGAVVQSRPTNLEPNPVAFASMVRKHAEMRTDPDRLLYIENRREGPQVTFSWELNFDYGAPQEGGPR